MFPIYKGFGLTSLRFGEGLCEHFKRKSEREKKIEKYRVGLQNVHNKFITKLSMLGGPQYSTY